MNLLQINRFLKQFLKIRLTILHHYIHFIKVRFIIWLQDLYDFNQRWMLDILQQNNFSEYPFTIIHFIENLIHSFNSNMFAGAFVQCFAHQPVGALANGLYDLVLFANVPIRVDLWKRRELG